MYFLPGGRAMDRSRPLVLNMWPHTLLRLLRGANFWPRSWVHQLLGLLAAERKLWLLALTAMVLDVQLTVQGLQLGLHEMNPVARQALDEAGLLGLYGLKSCALLVAVVLRPLVPDRYGGIVPLSLAIPSLIAVGINSTVLLVVV